MDYYDWFEALREEAFASHLERFTHQKSALKP
jgi:hypothetical protein